MARTPAQWIKDRLPSNAIFSDDRTVDVAITDALEDSGQVKELALADLLEQLASNDLYETYKEGDVTWSKPLLEAKAVYWRGLVEAGDSLISFVPATYHPTALSDEFDSGEL